MGMSAMVAQAEKEREPRNDKVALAVTRTEKAAVRAIAALRGTDESALCRSTPIAEIVREFERIRASQDTWDDL